LGVLHGRLFSSTELWAQFFSWTTFPNAAKDFVSLMRRV